MTNAMALKYRAGAPPKGHGAEYRAGAPPERHRDPDRMPIRPRTVRFAADRSIGHLWAYEQGVSRCSGLFGRLKSVASSYRRAHEAIRARTRSSQAPTLDDFCLDVLHQAVTLQGIRLQVASATPESSATGPRQRSFGEGE